MPGRFFLLKRTLVRQVLRNQVSTQGESDGARHGEPFDTTLLSPAIFSRFWAIAQTSHVSQFLNTVVMRSRILSSIPSTDPTYTSYNEL